LWHNGCVKAIIEAQGATEITRLKYEREGQRYASDVTDAEWSLIEPHIRQPSLWAGRATPSCERWWTRSCIWRGPAVNGGMLPKNFPPFTTVQGYFYDWRDNGLFEKINFALLPQAREAAGREPSPSAGIIDSQSVQTTRAVGRRGMMRPRRSKAASGTL